MGSFSVIVSWEILPNYYLENVLVCVVNLQDQISFIYSVSIDYISELEFLQKKEIITF